MEYLIRHAGHNDSNMSNITLSAQNKSKFSYQQDVHGPLPLYVMVMVLIDIAGVLGNSLVLYIIVRKRAMQTYTNWMIINLAASDLAVTLFCIPLYIPLLLEEKWIYGKVFCSLYYPIGSAQMFSSAFTLVNISYVRFCAICYPFKEQPSVFHAKIMIIVIRLVSFALPMPLIIVLKYDQNIQVCYENWDTVSQICYTVIVFLLGYVIPFASITIAYCCIIYEIVVKKRKRETILQDKHTLKENRMLVKLKLSIAVTVTFGMCVFPNQLVFMLYSFAKFESYQHHMDLLLGSHMLLFLYCAINPIIYNICSENFRRGTKKLLKRVTKTPICLCVRTSLSSRLQTTL